MADAGRELLLARERLDRSEVPQEDDESNATELGLQAHIECQRN